MTFTSRFLVFWNHPAGPKTIHFWAPLAKWGLVIAGLADNQRPAEKLSLQQSSVMPSSITLQDRGIYSHRQHLVILHTIRDFMNQTDNSALALTGVIWARYSTQIIPVNWSLFAVNIFVGATGIYQLYRIFNYRMSLPKVESN